jgi:RND superfamily putative drug exporter
MIGFGGLLFIGIPFMTSLGVGGMTVVAVAVAAALTLLPALLAVLGTRVNALRPPVLGRIMGATNRAEARDGGFWHALALGVMRRPILVILGVVVLLVGLGWPIFGLRVGTPDASALPADSEARQGGDILTAQFPQFSGNMIQLAVQTPDGSSILAEENLARLDALTQWLNHQPHVIGVISLTQFPVGQQGQVIPKEQLLALYSSGAYKQSPALTQLVGSMASGGTTIVSVRSDTEVGTDAAAAQIASLRAHKDAAGGLNVSVGGFQALTQDFNGYLYGNFPRAIAFVLLATFVVLLLMFRSLLLPLKAVLMNVLSLGAAYGVLVFVFVQGHFADQLHFEPSPTIDSTIPILLFCALFGLSMDYEVFLLSRIREEWLRTKDNRYAVARGLEKTGGVITNAALLFVIVTGAFTFTGIIITKEIGLGMTVAVLVDAAIIRTLLVPATMRLLGRWNWWLPGFPLPPKQRA